MSNRCTLETDDRPDSPPAGISEAQRILIITAATGELSRLWGPPAGTPHTEGPGAKPAVPRASAVETHRTRGYAMREAVARAASAASPLAGTSRHLRLLVLALFVVVIVACGVLAVAAYALPMP